MPDCRYQCQLQQGDCEGSRCDAVCSGSDCEGVTLATWSAADIVAGVQVSDDGLTVSGTRAAGGVRADVPLLSGRYYWEASADAIPSDGYAVVGVAPASWLLGSMLGDQVGQGIGLESTSTVLIDGAVGTPACSFRADDVIGVAVDLDAMRMYLSLNGLWQAGARPEQGEGGIDISALASGEIFPAAGVSRDAAVRANFGQTPFAHLPPSGFEPVFQR
jgi:hypothetical protein